MDVDAYQQLHRTSKFDRAGVGNFIRAHYAECDTGIIAAS
jgi:hypothetical protein